MSVVATRDPLSGDWIQRAEDPASGLSRAELQAVRVIADQSTVAVGMTITELAELAGVGEATVSRMCRKLGFKGFHALKIAIAQRAAPDALTDAPDGTERSNSVVQAAASQIGALLQKSVVEWDADAFVRAGRYIAEARRTHVIGLGSSGVTAVDAQQRFMYLGLTCTAAADPHLQIMAAAAMEPQDVLLVISVSGSTKDLISPVKLAAGNGARIICLTSAARSPIARLADEILIAGRPHSAPVGDLFHKISQLFVIELLVRECARSLGPRPARLESLIQDGLADRLY